MAAEYYNPIILPERQHAVCGVPGSYTGATQSTKSRPGCFAMQTWISERRPFPAYGPEAYIVAEIRHDDGCGNGHNSFAVTAHIATPGRRDWDACGCLHDEVAQAFPELAGLIKWHLCATDGPMHYVANTTYHASNGKLDAARSCAVWPDAPDDVLMLPESELSAILTARLSVLLAEFRAAVEGAGFLFERKG